MSVRTGACRTAERIVTAIREWVEQYGRTPTAEDWSPAKARLNGNPHKARRFELAEGRWPTTLTVQSRFGLWNAAIEAAGFIPRAIGEHGTSGIPEQAAA